MTSTRKIRAGLLQMRSGRKVDANIDAAAKLAREAKAAGADYIQTPEMTNLMEQSRKVLFSAAGWRDSAVSWPMLFCRPLALLAACRSGMRPGSVPNAGRKRGSSIGHFASALARRFPPITAAS
jgi:hypothetical protein